MLYRKDLRISRKTISFFCQKKNISFLSVNRKASMLFLVSIFHLFSNFDIRDVSSYECHCYQNVLTMILVYIIVVSSSVNDSQLAKMKKYIPYMPLP